MAREGDVGADSIMLSLRNSLAAQPLDAWTASYEIHLGRDGFTLRVVDGRLVETRRGQSRDQPDTIIDTDPTTLGALLGKEQTMTEAIETGKLTLTGDIEAAQRLLESRRDRRSP